MTRELIHIVLLEIVWLCVYNFQEKYHVFSILKMEKLFSLSLKIDDKTIKIAYRIITPTKN